MTILIRSRPDLKIFTIPTYPSGLGVVTGLNASSRVLVHDIDAICRQTMELELDDFQPTIDEHFNLIADNFQPASDLLTPASIPD